MCRKKATVIYGHVRRQWRINSAGLIAGKNCSNKDWYYIQMAEGLLCSSDHHSQILKADQLKVIQNNKRWRWDGGLLECHMRQVIILSKKTKTKKPKKQLIRHGREKGRVVLLLLIPSHKIFGFLSEKELMFAKWAVWASFNDALADSKRSLSSIKMSKAQRPGSLNVFNKMLLLMIKDFFHLTFKNALWLLLLLIGLAYTCMYICIYIYTL